ncbi:cyclomaltodextrin glucanotransferase [Permianibacter sp. IMCC34836]|uniref:alpha-amylase family glycosyl hydrolase n=1 Tax=Permianibacter fluminis TaxID=2738515 RepID=UPI001555C332|nr:alpha-amylase family glycosyl hydrolase [Permianibacter fluminis]NQD37512.1 cyclomaltodextrin glucanotransferase [Permianibacter fluminis]
MRYKIAALAVSAILMSACAQDATPPADEFYGTTEPFASEAIYFVMTDRFVNGDSANDQREQGGALQTFDRPVPGAPDGESDNIGYLGGDFKGLLDNVDYIRDMGFSAIWITPIVDNPDAVFTGGKPVNWGSFWTDQGKTGYHGYWGVNFYRLDEHLPSPGLDFAALTQALHGKNMKLVLDIVGNHGSPSYTMPVAQPEFGKIFAADGTLLADHQNLPPEQLDPEHNPLHRFYHTQRGVAELSDLNDENPAVLDYLDGAYSQWAEQGADAFRIDTIGWMPDAFWKKFADRIRAKRPGFFMFGEDFRWDAKDIAGHTQPENGGISVLDFPLKAGLAKVFEHAGSDYAELASALYLQGGPYRNPYELVTFYDNHDMARLNASDDGFIDANNWLFTARGIPAIYYGSETGFMRGRAEHAGNRNYFGQDRINAAPSHPIYQHLRRIARVRAESPALQKGLQLNLELKGDRAAFYRVYQHGGQAQTALVLLNKGDSPSEFVISDWLQSGTWRAAFDAPAVSVAEGGSLKAVVPAHGVQIYFLDTAVTRADLKAQLAALMVKP